MLCRLVSAIQVKRVPPELHAAIRRRAAEEGVTVSDYILDVLWRDLVRPSRRQWPARLASREPVEGADVVAALEATRTERDDAPAGG